MKTDFFRCNGCGVTKEFLFEASIPPTTDHPCDLCEKDAGWKRVWSAPHTGRGSSGEPPR